MSIYNIYYTLTLKGFLSWMYKSGPELTKCNTVSNDSWCNVDWWANNDHDPYKHSSSHKPDVYHTPFQHSFSNKPEGYQYNR